MRTGSDSEGAPKRRIPRPPVLLGLAVLAGMVAGSPLACPRSLELHLPDRVAEPVPTTAAPASTPVCTDFGAPEVIGRLPAGALEEVSGLVVSSVQPRLLWMHNDSGDGPYLYAVTRGGLLLGRLELEGAPARDWEDLADGPCPEPLAPATRCLYVGDVGDNLARRDDARILVVPEPEVDVRAPFGTLRTKGWLELPVRYPDGPSDCEALVVGADARPVLLTKGRSGAPQGYVYPPSGRPGEMAVLEPLGPLELPGVGDLLAGWVTAASLHPSGRHLLVRTYTAVYEADLAAGAPASGLTFEGHRLLPAADEPQGEAIAYDPEDGGFLTVSEKSRDVVRVPCRAARP